MREHLLPRILYDAQGAIAVSLAAGVIGFPITHSRSPAIFAFLAEVLNVTGLEYAAHAVAPAELARFLDVIRSRADFKGINVTIPHKEAILSLLDGVSPEAHAIGAVNAVDRREGKLFGRNTDVIGIQETLKEHGLARENLRALIFGAGGAARATAFALGQLSAKMVIILNRDAQRAERLAGEMKTHFPKTQFSVFKCAPHECDLVINATSVGLKSTDDASIFDPILTQLPKSAAAFDLIYNPIDTVFLQSARANGLKFLSFGGLEMLIYQALATWREWLGEIPNPTEIKNELSLYLRGILRGHQTERVVMTGFMGVGKSVIGKLFADYLGWQHLDTDQMIIEKAGTSISEIFARAGEEKFRELEAAAVKHALRGTKTVISLGGGALRNPLTLNAVQENAFLVYLQAEHGTIHARLQGSIATRPLLAHLSPDEQRLKIQALLEERAPTYRKAGLTLRTDLKSPAEIVKTLARLLHLSPGVKTA